MKDPIVSIIIVTLDNKEWLEECITALKKQRYRPIEIIVVDNGSNKSPKKFPMNNSLGEIYIHNSQNIGFGRAANKGIKKARGKYILIYNDDAICENNFITILIKAMEENPRLGACQGTLLSFDKPEIVESIGSFLTPFGILWKKAGFRYNLHELHQEYIFNANLPLIRKSVLDKIGLFDEDYFLYFEETDLCWRIWQSGYKIISVPQAKVWHKAGMTTKRMDHAFIIETTYHNRLNSLIKNLELRNALYIIPLHLIFLLIAFLSFLLLGKWRIAFGVCKAVVLNILSVNHTIYKRTLIQQMRKVNDKEIFKYGMKEMKIQYLLSTAINYFKEW